MKNLNLLALLVTAAIGNSACSNKTLDGLSPTRSSNAVAPYLSQQRVFWTNEPHAYTDLSGIPLTKNQIAKLSTVFQDENGNVLSGNYQLMPNSIYRILVGKTAPCEVVMKQGIGFTVLSSVEKDNQTLFVIKTIQDIPDKLIAELATKSLPTRNSLQVYRSRPQQFLFPNN